MANRAVRAISAVIMVKVLLAVGAVAYHFASVKPQIRAGRQRGIHASVPVRHSVGGFGFATENGARKSIADLKGKIVIVDVWATWF